MVISTGCHTHYGLCYSPSGVVRYNLCSHTQGLWSSLPDGHLCEVTDLLDFRCGCLMGWCLESCSHIVILWQSCRQKQYSQDDKVEREPPCPWLWHWATELINSGPVFLQVLVMWCNIFLKTHVATIFCCCLSLTGTVGSFFVFGLFHLARLIFVPYIIIAWHCLLPANGMPCNSFHLELVSCVWGERAVVLAAVENIATWISRLLKHVFLPKAALIQMPVCWIHFSSPRCTPWHESWWQRYIWHFEIFLATPTWSQLSSVKSRPSFTFSSNWGTSSLTRAAQTVYDGKWKPN